MSLRDFGLVFGLSRSLRRSRGTASVRRRTAASRRMPLAAETLETRAMLAGVDINGGLSWNGWTNRGLSNQGGLYGSGGTTGRDTYEVYTTTFAFAGNAIEKNPVQAVAPAPDGFASGRFAPIPGGREIRVSDEAFQAGNTILGIGVRATTSDGSIAGFWPTIRFDLDNDSYQPASFEVDSAGRTIKLNNDGRTSFTTYAEPGDFTVQFEGSASWRGSSISVREAATAQLPAATVRLPGGVGSGTSYDFAFRAFAQPAANAYQMFIDMTAIPKLYGSADPASVYKLFFPNKAGVGTIGDRVTVSLNGLGSNNVVFDANLTLPPVDLDVDSDNADTVPDPANDPVDRSAAEEAIEEDLARPGVIVPVGGSRAKMVVDVPHGRTATLAFDAAAAAKVKVFEASGAVALDRDRLSMPVIGGSPQTFWIEAFAPSATMADIAFTLTPTGGSPASPDTIRATAVAVDLSIDDLPADIEDGSGAYVWRNSDFTRRINAPDSRQTEAGVTRYLPDYTLLTTIDPAFADQFTKARATFTAGMATACRFRFDVGDPASVALWTTTQWDGFVAAGDGWWRIPTDADVQPKAITDTTLTFWIEGLRTTGYAAGRLEFKPVPMVPAPSGQPSRLPSSDAVRFTVLDAGLGVDGNRDGTIDFADSYDRQLTFWLNGDREVNAPYEQEDERFGLLPPSIIVKADADDERITTKRDLEDFAALHLIIDPAFQGSRSPFNRSLDRWDRPLANKPRVRFDLAMAAQGTGIRLFRAATSSARDHVEDPDAVALQVTRFNTNAEDSINTPVSRGAVPTTIGDLTLYAEFDATTRSQRPEFLFEAFGQPAKTTLTFTVTVTYPQPQGSGGAPRTAARSHELSLDLRSIKDFYTRMQVPYRIGARDDRFTHFVPGVTDLLPHFGAAQPLFTGKTGDMPFLSGSDTVVLVHGWNMTDGTQTNGPPGDWKKAFAETAFKRLYWQGFRGNFTAFDWPTFADQEGSLQGVLEFFNFTYNASEYQAFRSGRSLMTFLADKKATGSVHLLAHSMGNVVAAEALRQWTAAGNAQPLVTNYVAMQGALSAGAYGDDATDATGADPSGYDYYRYWPDRWLGTERRYYMQGTDQAAGRWINMFNEVDRATSAELGWVGNNRMKPRGGDIWTVQSATGSPTPQFIGYRVDRPEYGGRLLRSYAVNGLPCDEIDLKQWLVAPGPGQLPGPSAYEVLAFMSKASAKPIGTKSVRFFGTNIDISDLGLIDPYVREWPGHSFQFHFDAATTAQFWKRVVDETGMNTVSNPRNP